MFLLSVSQSDYNSVAIIVLLLIIVYFVSGFNKKFSKLLTKDSFNTYLNTQAKIKSVEFAPNGIVTIHIDGFIVSWNKGAEAMFGYKESEVLGKSLTLIIPEQYKEKHLQGIQRLKAGGESKLLGNTIEISAVTKGKVEFPVKLTLWKWSEDNNIFYTGIIQDITARKEKEKEVASKLDVYYRAEEITDSGVWSWDVLNDTVYTSQGFDRIFDIEGHRGLDSTYLLKRVYHEDLPKVEAAIKKAFENKESYEVEYRVVTRNGNLIDVIVKAETYLDKEGNLINITGIIHKLDKK